jgi:universal stress protein F
MNSRSTNVIVGMDFSLFSAYALDHAISMSKHTSFQIHLVYLIENSHEIIGGSINTNEEQIKQWFTLKLEELKKSFQWDNYTFDIHILNGKPYIEIPLLAKKLNAQFVFLGANSSNKNQSNHTGSNVLRIISNAECTVVVLKERDTYQPYHTILLPLELNSMDDYPVVNFTIDFLKDFSNMTVRIISVFNNKTDAQINTAIEQIGFLQKKIEDAGYKFSAEIVKSNRPSEKISEIIMDYSGKCESDVVFLYHHRSTELKGYFLGPVALEITNRINIPVFIMNT